MRRAVLLAAALALVAACAGGDDAAAPPETSTSTTAGTSTSTAATATDDRYADPASWLCRPDTDDPCEEDMDATVVQADGTTSPSPFRAAADAPIDCFYVYPTVSLDPGANSDMVPGTEERTVVRRQAARFGSACRLYAPMYRQATLTALQQTMTGQGGDFFAAYTEAYDDVLAAWRHYLTVDNHGRGVIVIGHSQGASHLLKLLREQIDPDAAQRALLVSAMLVETSAHESELPHIPPCRATDQTGCIITYSSFLDTAPPPPGAYFAQPKGAEPAICTNPAALAGGAGTAEGFYSADGWGVDVPTPWVEIPGLVTTECKDVGGFNHLSLTVHPDPGPRSDELRGGLTPQWGMHRVDLSVAQANLVAIARAEGEGYTG